MTMYGNEISKKNEHQDVEVPMLMFRVYFDFEEKQLPVTQCHRDRQLLERSWVQYSCSSQSVFF